MTSDITSKIYLFVFRKSFWKTSKNEEEGKKQIDGIPIKSKKLVALTNKGDDHKDNYKEVFEELVKEKFDEIKELTNEINQNELIYYFKGNTARRRFSDFNNGIELFEKVKSGKIKLKEAKKLQNVFKSNLNEAKCKSWRKEKGSKY